MPYIHRLHLAEADMVHKDQPPFGVFCSNICDLLGLFFDTDPDVLFEFWNEPTSGISVNIPAQNETIREGYCARKQIQSELVGNGYLLIAFLPVAESCECKLDRPPQLS